MTGKAGRLGYPGARLQAAGPLARGSLFLVRAGAAGGEACNTGEQPANSERKTSSDW